MELNTRKIKSVIQAHPLAIYTPLFKGEPSPELDSLNVIPVEERHFVNHSRRYFGGCVRHSGYVFTFMRSLFDLSNQALARELAVQIFLPFRNEFTSQELHSFLRTIPDEKFVCLVVSYPSKADYQENIGEKSIHLRIVTHVLGRLPWIKYIRLNGVSRHSSDWKMMLAVSSQCHTIVVENGSFHWSVDEHGFLEERLNSFSVLNCEDAFIKLNKPSTFKNLTLDARAALLIKEGIDTNLEIVAFNDCYYSKFPFGVCNKNDGEIYPLDASLSSYLIQAAMKSNTEIVVPRLRRYMCFQEPAPVLSLHGNILPKNREEMETSGRLRMKIKFDK